MQSYVLLLVIFVSYVYSTSYILRLNSNASAFRDIHSIAHDPEGRQVVITLNKYRRCENPTFMVRLSGASLYLMDLVAQVHAQGSPERTQYSNEISHFDNTFNFSYPELVDLGDYFIEVLVLVCTKVDYNDFRSVCVEDFQEGRNVLNLPFSFQVTKVDGTESRDADLRTLRRPRWVNTGTAVPLLLPTRYQSTRCDYYQYNGMCKEGPSALVLHHLYRWTDPPEYATLLKQVLTQLNTPVGKYPILTVCLVGASFSFFIDHHTSPVLPAEVSKYVHFQHIKSYYPHELDLAAIAQARCSYAVIGYGQWPLSFKPRQPYNHSQQEASLRDVLGKINRSSNKTTSSGSSGTQFFLRSLSYNSLGAHYASCPPLDYRLPHIVRHFNTLQQALCAELGVGFIDTSEIDGPLWDAAPDWIHPPPRVFIAQGEMILHSVLAHSLRDRSMPPVVDEYIIEPENTLIRFTNGPTVYLHKNGTIHAFPSGAVFLAQGYDFDDVKVLHANKYHWYVVGDDII